MCGITGVVSFTEEGKKYLAGTSAAAYSLLKRGPDGEGIVFFENAAFGHRRLKIIDTSNKAAQPMSDAGKRFTIVFNGEIFNYRELKKDLLAKGITFKSESDTEVLLQLFILEKEKCLEKLDGEFAFAVYDKQDESLFLARDRFGIKPLYYFSDTHKFIFGSEMKAILAYGIPKKIDRTSLLTYLQLNYVPSPDSILEGVKKIQAGSYAYVKTGTVDLHAYYTLPSPISDAAKNYEAAQKELHTLLTRSVQNRMIADVPLGTFLSGGIDSSIISAIAARHTSHLKTFSIGFKDEKYFDETHYARLVAKKLKTEHTVFSLSNADLFENLHAVLDYTDEPFADSSALAVHILSMHTKKQVTVALSGDGADELFGGYNKHAAELKLRKAGLVTRLAGSAGKLLNVLPSSRNSKLGNKVRQLKKFNAGKKLSEKERYWAWAGYASEEKAEKLLAKDPAGTIYTKRKDTILSSFPGDLNAVLHTDMKLVLENDMLVKVDRMSMANSLEVRVPFLDPAVVAFAFSLPVNFKIDGKRRKKIVKDAFRNELPDEVFHRGKQGFEVPLLKWFRSELRSMITDDLLSERFVNEQGLFDPASVKKLKAELFSNDPGDSVARIWGLIVFQYWWKKYFSTHA